MKDQLISIIVDKTGIDQGKAEQAVDAIVGFIKENPDKLQSLLGDNPADIGKSIGKLFGR